MRRERGSERARERENETLGSAERGGSWEGRKEGCPSLLRGSATFGFKGTGPYDVPSVFRRVCGQHSRGMQKLTAEKRADTSTKRRLASLAETNVSVRVLWKCLCQEIRCLGVCRVPWKGSGLLEAFQMYFSKIGETNKCTSVIVLPCRVAEASAVR